MLKEFYIFLFLSLLILLLCNSLNADEFDGGIPIGEPITDKLDKSLNIQYIKRNAMAKAKRGSSIGNTECGGTGNQTFGPGANLQGATIVNLSDNKGANSTCFK